MKLQNINIQLMIVEIHETYSCKIESSIFIPLII